VPCCTAWTTGRSGSGLGVDGGRGSNLLGQGRVVMAVPASSRTMVFCSFMLRLRVVATAADGESDIVNSGMFRSMRLAHAVGRTGPRWKGNSPRPTFLHLLLCASSFKHCDADHRVASSLRRQQKKPRLPERSGLVDHDAFCCSDAPQKISDRGRLHRAHQIGDGLLTALVIESVRAAYSSLCRTASLELTAVPQMARRGDGKAGRSRPPPGVWPHPSRL